MLDQPTQEQIAIIRAHNQMNDSYAFALFGSLATLVGTPLLIRGLSTGLKIVSLLTSVVLGACVGWLIAMIGFYCQDWLPMWDPLVRSAVLRSAMFVPLGLLGGILTTAFHQVWGKGVNLLLGGIIGAVCAATLYCLLAGFLFHNENSDAVLPVGLYSRLLLFGVTPFLTWAFIVMQYSAGGEQALEPVSRQIETA